MQNPDEIIRSYDQPDPWKFECNPHDIRRKAILVGLAAAFGPYEKLLDLGCGDGWIAMDMPAKEKHGYELAPQCKPRCEKRGVKIVETPDSGYDLVTASGVLYEHYDWEVFAKMIQVYAKKHVIVSHIAEWEMDWVKDGTIGKQLFHATIVGYRQYSGQSLRVFEVGK